MHSYLDRHQAHVLGILRIVAALTFISHGTQKLFGFPVMPPSGSLPPVMSLFWFAGILECVGGLLVLLGLKTRIAAFVLSGQMAFAYWIGHAPKSFYPIVNGGDSAILYCFVFLYLVFAGAGAFSADGRTRSTSALAGA